MWQACFSVCLASSASNAWDITGAGTMIAIDQTEQRHRFLAQRMDDVMVVDDVAALTAPLRRPTTLQGQELRGAEVTLAGRRRGGH